MDGKRQAIEAIIEGRQEALPVAAREDEGIQFVIVTLAGQLYAFFGTAVIAIAKVRDIVPIPGTRDYVLGVMYYQGRVESVIDIRKIMGLEEAATGRAIDRKSRVVMAVSGGVHCGVLVEAVEDVVELPSSGIYAPLETIGPAVKEFVAGETDYRERSVVILDLAKIFARVMEQGNDAQ